ncbi:MAG: hypothetical protein HKN78_06805 [Sphingomonadaceae bacterium]|nr:hypothetical protein [Sphingomonadaceae bacterium]
MSDGHSGSLAAPSVAGKARRSNAQRVAGGRATIDMPRSYRQPSFQQPCPYARRCYSQIMASERLNRSIEKIEQAIARLEESGRAGAAKKRDDPAKAALAEQLAAASRDHEAALEERERTIAKLRADAQDIDALKDEEIARLRDEIERQRQTAPQAPPAGINQQTHDRLKQKYAALEQSARQALGRLDELIAETAAESG